MKKAVVDRYRIAAAQIERDLSFVVAEGRVVMRQQLGRGTMWLGKLGVDRQSTQM